MKLFLSSAFVYLSTIAFAQSNNNYDAAVAFLTRAGIKLNVVNPPSGFTVYYNCDSLLFMKATCGDTIKIWTPGMDWYESLDEFKNIVHDENFGVTKFPISIDSTGRIYVSTYHLTEFLYRHDSLFEIEDSSQTPSTPMTSLFTAYLARQIDDSTYKARLDSLQQVEQEKAVYIPKLIFAKSMFKGNRQRVKLPRKVNFQQDVIVLEHQWIQNGKTCYSIRINNKEDGDKTTYAYAFDEDMKFVF